MTKQNKKMTTINLPRPIIQCKDWSIRETNEACTECEVSYKDKPVALIKSRTDGFAIVPLGIKIGTNICNELSEKQFITYMAWCNANGFKTAQLMFSVAEVEQQMKTALTDDKISKRDFNVVKDVYCVVIARNLDYIDLIYIK